LSVVAFVSYEHYYRLFQFVDVSEFLHPA
jgi:hypothetical protein